MTIWGFTGLRECGRNVDVPETTKPLHFCRGFVLYGAAPGVELDINLLIYRDYFFCNVISISTDTLVMQNADAGT